MTETFKHRAIQDLAWVISSPPLITGLTGLTPNTIHWFSDNDCQHAFQQCLPALQALDKDPNHLLEHLQQLKSQRLGIRFEALVAYWLTLSAQYEILYQNHQLHHAGKTLGEIDFIIRELATGKTIHLEVAVKFYLGRSTEGSNSDLNAMNQWYGTNLHDRLDIKYQHLVNHQTQLSTLYPDLMPCPVDEVWCMLKGRLFYPKSHTTRQTPFINKTHLTGYWQYVDTVQENGAMNPHYQALNKNDWLALIHTSTSNLRLQHLPSQLERSQCFAYCTEVNDKDAKGDEDKHHVEQDRFFLLPKNFWALAERLP